MMDITHIQPNSMIANDQTSELQKRWSYIGMSHDDAAILRELLPIIEKHADRFVDEFYQNIARFPELLQLISHTGTTIDSLKNTQKENLLDMFRGDYSTLYIQKRLKIGTIHHKIGLTHEWYVGSYAIYFQKLLPVIEKHFRFRPKKRQKALLAFNRIVSLDITLSMDSYIHSLLQQLSEKSHSQETITNEIHQVGQVIQKVAKGDLSQRCDLNQNAAFSELSEDLNVMIESLGNMSSHLFKASDQISQSLQEVQSAVQAHSSGAGEQAAAVNQTTTTLEEIKATSQQTLEKAQLLGHSAERSREEGSKGLEAVEHSIDVMHGIRSKVEEIAKTILSLSEQTQKIGEITSAVNNLAQQSKMLALNASIEAAKAGEAGKGFAVVADEVKILAEQSHQFTVQVHRILEEIRHAADKAVMATEDGRRQVDQGTVMMEQSSQVVRHLSEITRETSMSSQQIVAAVRQEAAGIDQITIAMKEINKVTRQFVEAAQQTSHAVDQMSIIAETLAEHVKVYKF
ncbi:protoglobin domain-containing protein [Magnetococcales bacterium HHB-1]